MQENAKKKEFYAKDKLEDYLHAMRSRNKEFSEVSEQYQEAYRQMKNVFGDTEHLVALYEQMAIFSIEFAFQLGMDANLAHFKDPLAPTFMDDDYNLCLKEEAMRETPEYTDAYTQVHNIVSAMPKEVYGMYDKIAEYFTFLATYIPKISHYSGYIQATVALKTTIRGYDEDVKLTQAYTDWLTNYLEMSLPL